ncbi:MAG TPA: BatA domain-containing protein [Prolixibacteraceae bacterium]|nr:BatA domain-containing protein [Prolixibacteraceae bacterium]
MSFLYPAFLFALLTLAIPVIIHLFNFRKYKTLYFSNVHLLKLIKQESRKKSRLKQLIIMFARLLAIACLVIAFSRPFIPVSDHTSHAAQQIVEVYIDNTFSMKNENEKGQLLAQAKSKAIEIANAYRSGTRFLLLTSEFLPQQQFFLTKEQFIQQVSEITESPRSPKFSQIYAQAVQSISAETKKSDKILYFLSDFQKNSMDMESIKPDSSVFTYLLPFTAAQTNNLLIDSCWFDNPVRKAGQQEKLFVHLRNLSAQSYQHIPVRLNINDSLRSIANVNIAGKQDTILELNYTNQSDGMQLCKVELDDYPITYDNSFFISYKVRGTMKALGIYNPANNGSTYLKALFNGDELVKYDEFPENNVQTGQLKDYQCIFLIGNKTVSSGLKSELISFVEQGGSLVLIPNREIHIDDYNALLSGLGGKTIASYDTSAMRITEINYSNPLYQDVFKKQQADADLPIIHGFLKYNQQIHTVESPLLKFRDGENAISAFRYGKGNVYSFAFPVDKGNFSFIRHIVFVPTVYNMVLNSEAPQRYSYPMQGDEPVTLDQNQVGDEVRLINHQTNDEFKVATRNTGAGNRQIILDDIIGQAGHYILYNGNTPAQSLSFNYSREESVPDLLNATQINDLLNTNSLKKIQLIDASATNFSTVLQDLNNGKQLWKLFVMFSILFLLIEMAVIKFWK